MRNKNIFIQKQTNQTKTKNPNNLKTKHLSKFTKSQTCDKFYRDRQLNFSTSSIGIRYLQNESKTLIL